MNHKNKYSHHSSIILPVWLNGCVVIYELGGCVFESPWSQLNVRYGALLEQEVPLHSGKL